MASSTCSAAGTCSSTASRRSLPLPKYRRLLKPGGLAYIEVPAPDTSAHHETNPNHYSVLPRSMWIELFGRAGFDTQLSMQHSFTLPCGPDKYWGFLLRVK